MNWTQIRFEEKLRKVHNKIQRRVICSCSQDKNGRAFGHEYCLFAKVSRKTQTCPTLRANLQDLLCQRFTAHVGQENIGRWLGKRINHKWLELGYLRLGYLPRYVEKTFFQTMFGLMMAMGTCRPINTFFVRTSRSFLQKKAEIT